MNGEDIATWFPAIADLEALAIKRIPHFAWEYLDSGTGLETAIARNRAALDGVLITPRFMMGDLKPELSTELFGKKWAVPFGIAPVGLTGMLWPGGELMLARAAVRENMPYCLSSFACNSPEAIGEAAGGNAWFQLYTMNDASAEDDLIARAGAAGFSALIVTVDVPVNSTRERQRKAGLARKKPLGLAQYLQMATKPHWLRAAAQYGKPQFRALEKYFPGASMSEIAARLERMRLGMNSMKGLARIRERWKKPLIIKGILHEDDACKCVELGAEAIVVSNHGARQFDAAPASIDVLPAIAAAVGGKTKILFDSGVRSGLDILRALALGADFVLSGRPFLYGIGALGEAGADHVACLFRDDLASNMMQSGVEKIADLRQCRVSRVLS